MSKVDWPSNTFLGKKCGQKTPKILTNTKKHIQTEKNLDDYLLSRISFFDKFIFIF